MRNKTLRLFSMFIYKQKKNQNQFLAISIFESHTQKVKIVHIVRTSDCSNRIYSSSVYKHAYCIRWYIYLYIAYVRIDYCTWHWSWNSIWNWLDSLYYGTLASIYMLESISSWDVRALSIKKQHWARDDSVKAFGQSSHFLHSLNHNKYCYCACQRSPNNGKLELDLIHKLIHEHTHEHTHTQLEPVCQLLEFSNVLKM